MSSSSPLQPPLLPSNSFMDSHSHPYEPISFLPVPETPNAPAALWTALLKPHLMTRSPRTVVLLVGDDSAREYARALVDSLCALSVPIHLRPRGVLLIDEAAATRAVEDALEMLPGRVILLTQASILSLIAKHIESLKLLSERSKSPLVLVIEKHEWSLASESLRRESIPYPHTVIDAVGESLFSCLRAEAKLLEDFYGVDIPEETVKAACELIPGAETAEQPLLGTMMLDLWASSASLSEQQTVLPERAQRRSCCIDRKRLVARLLQSVQGQDAAVNALADQVILGESDLRMRTDRPASSILLSGPTGTGKTLLAQSLATALGVDLIRVDMGALNSEHLTASLLGAPPGYAGSNTQDRWLTSRIARTPHCVLLLDEVDKASPDVWAPILLELLGAGTLTDYCGQTVDARGIHVILTANTGAVALTRSNIGFGEGVDRTEAALREIRALMTPELFNRLDGIVIMEPLNRARMGAILDSMLDTAIETAGAAGFLLHVEEGVRESLLDEAMKHPDGVRRLHRTIEAAMYRPLLSRRPGSYLVRAANCGVIVDELKSPEKLVARS